MRTARAAVQGALIRDVLLPLTPTFRSQRVSSPDMSPLIVRADADARMGAGHFMRCLALAQAWVDNGGEAAFLTSSKQESLLERVRGNGVGVRRLEAAQGDEQDLALTLDLLEEAAAVGDRPALCLDGYDFTSDYHREVREAGYRLLVIDDHAHLDRYIADLLLNQNPDAGLLQYDSPRQTEFLFGPRYALLRREFRDARIRRRTRPEEARRLLVTLGAGDPANVTGRVVQELSVDCSQRMECVVVAGPANPHLEALRGAVSEADRKGGASFRLVVDAREMPDLMGWADLAVSAAGSTCWELCFMGVPSILLIAARNQEGIAKGLHSRGAAVSLGWHDEVPSGGVARAVAELASARELRSSLAGEARRLVDGRGGERVVRALQRQLRSSQGGTW